MKCPVCDKQIENMIQKCTHCGFEDLRTEFINENELEMWRTYVVYPCKFAYQTSIAQTKELEKKLKKELSAIKKAQKDAKGFENTTGDEAPSFKKISFRKDDGWFTKSNISYKGFYVCDHNKFTTCEISNLDLDIVASKITVNFFAKKTYDWKGNSETGMIAFKWKLKDDYGIVVADGSWANTNLNIGDVTKGAFSISGLDPSVKYALELVNY